MKIDLESRRKECTSAIVVWLVVWKIDDEVGRDREGEGSQRRKEGG